MQEAAMGRETLKVNVCVHKRELERERENDFESHLKNLKSARVRIDSVTVMQELRLQM